MDVDVSKTEAFRNRNGVNIWHHNAVGIAKVEPNGCKRNGPEN